jgi:alpha-1,6-mannosyltransferase
MTQRRAQAWLLVAGIGILLLTLVAVSLHQPGSIWAGTLARKDGIVCLMLASAMLYAFAVWLVTTLTVSNHFMVAIIGVSVALRVLLLASPPFMSSDVYRYVWDGRVQVAGYNPYAFIPQDPAIANLRDTAIYENINRKEYARTIYPPAAQILFAAVAQISQTVLAMKIALVVLETCGMVAVMRLLTIAGLPVSRILIYAWNPLAAWAVAGDGHIDGAAIGLLGLAMWSWAARRDGLAGALLGCAILTKFLPIVVVPAMWRRWTWKLPVFCVVTIVALYACYANIGWRVFGFLPTYTTEEGLQQGSGFWLLAVIGHIVRLPSGLGTVYVLASAAALGVLAYKITNPGPIVMASNVALLAAGTIAAMSPHYSWYYGWLALPCCLRVWPSVLWLSVAPLVLYSDPFHDELLLESAVFVPAILLAVRDFIIASPRPPRLAAAGNT